MKMEIRIAVCDDDAVAAKHITGLVDAWGKSGGVQPEISSYPSAEAFLFEFDQTQNFDLLLLDIEMDGMSGVTLAKQLRAQKRDIEIIFVTTHREFYGEGYEVDALHYLIKPVSAEKLFSALSRAAARLEKSAPPVIINTGGETVRLERKSILYVEAFRHSTEVKTESGRLSARENLSDFEARLGDGFFRCHRSYLVSLEAIVRITRSSVTLSNGDELPLARGKYDEINLAYIKHYS